MKKTLMFILMLAVCLLVAPSVYAEEVEYPTVTNATKSDSLLSGVDPVVEGSGTGTVTVKVNGGTFKILGDGISEGVKKRPAGYTWIGLHFDMPADITNDNEIKIQNNHDEAYTKNGFDEYFGFKTDELQAAVASGKTLTQTYTLTWKDKNSTQQTQTINIVIDLENVVVIEQNSEKEAWNQDIYHTTKGDVKLTITAIYSGDESGFNATRVVYLPKDSKVPTEASLRKSLKDITGTEYAIEGFYSDDAMTKKFDFSKTLSSDTNLFVKIVDAKKETTPAKVDKSSTHVSNPATGDNLLIYVSLGAVALIGVLGASLYLKKVNE